MNPPRYIIDSKGKKIAVVLPVRDYQKILEELEELEDIRLYDQAKKSADGKRTLFTDYLKKRKKKHD